MDIYIMFDFKNFANADLQDATAPYKWNDYIGVQRDTIVSFSVVFSLYYIYLQRSNKKGRDISRTNVYLTSLVVNDLRNPDSRRTLWNLLLLESSFPRFYPNEIKRFLEVSIVCMYIDR